MNSFESLNTFTAVWNSWINVSEYLQQRKVNEDSRSSSVRANVMLTKMPEEY